MRVKIIAFGLGFALVIMASGAAPVTAQKIIHIKTQPAPVFVRADLPGAKLPKRQRVKDALKPMRIRKFGKLNRARRVHRSHREKGNHRLFRSSVFSLPDQTLFPPYYAAPQPYSRGPDMASRIEGGKTIRQGSNWRSHIEGGKTVGQGATASSRIMTGRTVEAGSRWATRMVTGRTVEGGSRWRSTMPNWRFSGYAAPMRPMGIPYYRTKRRRGSPWDSRLR